MRALLALALVACSDYELANKEDPVGTRTGVVTSSPACTADSPPSITFDAPADGTNLPTGPAVPLVATVGDDLTDPADLVVTFASDVDGDLGAAVPDASGVATRDWLWPRTVGPHVLTASVTDSCGQVADATVQVCQEGGFTEDEIDLAAWHFEGSAQWDATNAWVQLTDATPWLVGSAFDTSHTVRADAVTLRFRFFIGDGTGADGMSVTALDVARQTAWLGGDGCGIGYGGNAYCTPGPALPGWTLEIDTFYNAGQDPTPEDHLAFTFDGDLTNVAKWVVVPELEDTGWHELDLEVAAPHVRVTIDGVAYIDEDLAGYYGFDAYVGFTAGTGGSTNAHLVDSLEVEQTVCP